MHSGRQACFWQESTQKIDILEWVPDRNTPARSQQFKYTLFRPACPLAIEVWNAFPAGRRAGTTGFETTSYAWMTHQERQL
ncbi:MAG: hypothetical protein WBC65_10090 [Ignavibacteria bacterium]